MVPPCCLAIPCLPGTPPVLSMGRLCEMPAACRPQLGLNMSALSLVTAKGPSLEGPLVRQAGLPAQVHTDLGRAVWEQACSGRWAGEGSALLRGAAETVQGWGAWAQRVDVSQQPRHVLCPQQAQSSRARAGSRLPRSPRSLKWLRHHEARRPWTEPGAQETLSRASEVSLGHHQQRPRALAVWGRESSADLGCPPCPRAPWQFFMRAAGTSSPPPRDFLGCPTEEWGTPKIASG